MAEIFHRARNKSLSFSFLKYILGQCIKNILALNTTNEPLNSSFSVPILPYIHAWNLYA